MSIDNLFITAFIIIMLVAVLGTIATAIVLWSYYVTKDILRHFRIRRYTRRKQRRLR